MATFGHGARNTCVDCGNAGGECDCDSPEPAPAVITGPAPDAACVHTLQDKIRSLQTECTELHAENERLRARPSAASAWLEVEYHLAYRLYRRVQICVLAQGGVQAVLTEGLCEEEVQRWTATAPTADAAVQAALSVRAGERAERARVLRAEAAMLESLDPWK